MCFTQEMSAAFALIGSGLTYYFYKRQEKFCKIWLIFLFYTIMEWFQTIQFNSLNQCDSFENKFLTNIAMILVIVQPLLWNYYYYTCMADNDYRKGIFTLGIILSIVWIIGYLSRYGGWKPEDGEDLLRGPLCTRKEGKGHFYWTFPMGKDHALSANFFMYLIIWFVPLFFSKQGVGGAIWIIVGALISLLFTSSNLRAKMEFASTWCFISIPLAIIGVILMICEEMIG